MFPLDLARQVSSDVMAIRACRDPTHAAQRHVISIQGLRRPCAAVDRARTQGSVVFDGHSQRSEPFGQRLPKPRHCHLSAIHEEPPYAEHSDRASGEHRVRCRIGRADHRCAARNAHTRRVIIGRRAGGIGQPRTSDGRTTRTIVDFGGPTIHAITNLLFPLAGCGFAKDRSSFASEQNRSAEALALEHDVDLAPTILWQIDEEQAVDCVDRVGFQSGGDVFPIAYQARTSRFRRCGSDGATPSEGVFAAIVASSPVGIATQSDPQGTRRRGIVGIDAETDWPITRVWARDVGGVQPSSVDGIEVNPQAAHGERHRKSRIRHDDDFRIRRKLLIAAQSEDQHQSRAPATLHGCQWSSVQQSNAERATEMQPIGGPSNRMLAG